MKCKLYLSTWLRSKSASDGRLFSIKCGTKKPGAFQLAKANDIKFLRLLPLSAKVTKAGFFPLFIFFELNSCQVRPALSIRVSITKTRKNLANQCESKRFVKLISPQVFFFFPLPLCYRNILSNGTECYFHLYPISFYGCGIFMLCRCVRAEEMN